MNKKKEKGSALILTLGILSMVLVLSMAFAFTARTNKQIAIVNADGVKADLIADSAQNLVLAWMKNKGKEDVHIASSSQFTRIIDKKTKEKANQEKANQYVFFGSLTHPPESIFPNNDKLKTDLYEDLNYPNRIFTSHSTYLNRLNKLIYKKDNNDEQEPFNDGSLSFYTIKTEKEIITYEKNEQNEDIKQKKHKIDEIVGRYAFVVLDESAKLDINAILPKNSTIGNAPFIKNGEARIASVDDNFASQDYFYDIFDNHKYSNSISNWSNGSSGYYDDFPFKGLTINGVKHIPTNYYTEQKSKINSDQIAPWLTYSQLVTSGIFSDENTSDEIPSDIFKYTIFSGDSPESFWTSEGEKARFDLTGYEWKKGEEYYSDSGSNVYEPKSTGSWEKDSEDYNVRLEYAQGLVKNLTSSSTGTNFWKDGGFSGTRNAEDVGAPSETIPWLYNQTQIAANLVDYCDSDSVATFGPNESYNLDNFEYPEYFGNERTPYFSEIAFICTPICTPNTQSDTPMHNYSLNLQPIVEFYNPFNDDLYSQNATIVIEFKYKWDPPAEGATHDWIPATKKILLSSTSISANSYGTVAGQTEQLASLPNVRDIFDNEPQKEILQFKVTKIVMYTSNKTDNDKDCYYDLAVWHDSSDGTLIVDTTGQDAWLGMGGNPYESTLEAKDPACNFVCGKETELWEMRKFDSKFYTTEPDPTNKDNYGTFSSLGEKNSNHYSTQASEENIYDNDRNYCANIKNRPIETLNELGKIQRGEPGRTINLLKYRDIDTVCANSSDTINSDIGNYTLGDANILDQVKIGPAKFTKGLFNSYGIKQLEKVADSENSETVLSHLMDNESIKLKSSGVSSSEMIKHSRVAIITQMLENIELGYYDDEEKNTTEKLEEYLAKLVNLCSARYEAFTIAIAAQPLRQLGSSQENDNGISKSDFENMAPYLLNPIIYTEKIDESTSTKYYCEILGTQVRLVFVLHDTWTNTFSIVQTEKLQ